MVCGGDEYICRVILCRNIPYFKIYWQILKMITVVVIEDKGGGGNIHYWCNGIVVILLSETLLSMYNHLYNNCN